MAITPSEIVEFGLERKISCNCCLMSATESGVSMMLSGVPMIMFRRRPPTNQLSLRLTLHPTGGSFGVRIHAGTFTRIRPSSNFRITTSDLPVVANPLGYIVRRERSNSLDEDDEHEVLRGVLPSKEDGDGPVNRGSGLWRAVPLSMPKISIIIAFCAIGLGWSLYSRPVGQVSSDTFALSSQIHTLGIVTSEQRGQLLAQSQRIEEATDICKTLAIHHRNILERSESLQRSFQLHDTVLDDLTARLVSVSLQVEDISRTSETQGQQYAQVENLKTQIEYLSTGLQRTASILEEVTREVALLREELAWIVPQVESMNNFAREWKEADWARSEAAKKAGESEATLLGLQHRTSELENDYQSLFSLAREWKEATRERNDVIEKVSEAGATWFQLQHRIAALEDRYRSLETQTLSVRAWSSLS
ncbi:hypothetical protein IMY05_C0191000300 [Salix suchowensis]|nr:hypothetical protein IMY05_C0191000300 [Salix suchowensis]